MKPVIGLIAKHTTENSRQHLISGMIRVEIADAVRYAGGIPIGIPSPSRERFLKLDAEFSLRSYERDYFLETLTLCHGLIFQGGSRITNAEIAMARLAHEKGIPTLGICSGQTVMAYAVSDVEMSDVNTDLHGTSKHSRHHIIYPTLASDDSILYHITKDILPEHQMPHLSVTSRHTKTIRLITNSPLTSTATAPDSHYEVIEDLDHLFYLGARFHPESDYLVNPLSSRLFRALINAANEYREATTSN